MDLSLQFSLPLSAARDPDDQDARTHTHRDIYIALRIQCTEGNLKFISVLSLQRVGDIPRVSYDGYEFRLPTAPCLPVR